VDQWLIFCQLIATLASIVTKREASIEETELSSAGFAVSLAGAREKLVL
jgi:hypothetical protein